MKLTDFSLLSISQYQIKLKTQFSTRLPVFLGSTLRGAFGHALKDTVCIVNHRNCKKCMIVDKCSYPYLFETSFTKAKTTTQNSQQIPHPFILSSPLSPNSRPGDYQIFTPEKELTFDLTLIGRAIDYLPYIIYSLNQMAKKGLGLVNRTSFELDQVLSLDGSLSEIIYESKTEKLSSPTASKLSNLVENRLTSLPTNISEQITLQFITPARIRTQNQLQAELSFPLLIRNLLRRMSLLCEFHAQELWQQNFAGLLKLASEVQTKTTTLRWWDFERYSNRQKTHMKLGGFIGTVTYTGKAIREFLPLIIAGEFLHVGGSTSFGLGKYKIID